MIVEAIMFKICFDEGQLELYLSEHNQLATLIHASYDEDTERECYYVQVEKW